MKKLEELKALVNTLEVEETNFKQKINSLYPDIKIECYYENVLSVENEHEHVSNRFIH